MTCVNLSVLIEGVSKIVFGKEGVICAQMLVLHCSCFRRGNLTIIILFVFDVLSSAVVHSSLHNYPICHCCIILTAAP